MKKKVIGLIVNPVAGMGGSVGLNRSKITMDVKHAFEFSAEPIEEFSGVTARWLWAGSIRSRLCD